MNIVVLGGTGYLGRNIIKKMSEYGHEITYTVRNPGRIGEFEKRIKSIKADEEHVEKYFSSHKIDTVINTVCTYGRENVSFEDIIEGNLLFPLKILNLAVKYNIRNFITIGTGLPDDFNMYSMTKREFSDFGRFYSKHYNLNFIELESEMIYGGEEPKDRFIAMCISKMLLGLDIELTEGNQKRDIIYVEDVCDIIQCVLSHSVEGYQIIPVGTGDAPTIRQIVEYIHQYLKSESNLKFGILPMREGEPDCVANITKLRQMGFSCRYDWKEGLKKAIEDVKINK